MYGPQRFMAAKRFHIHTVTDLGFESSFVNENIQIVYFLRHRRYTNFKYFIEVPHPVELVVPA